MSEKEKISEIMAKLDVLIFRLSNEPNFSNSTAKILSQIILRAFNEKDSKFRKISIESQTIKTKILITQNALKILLLIGFEQKGNFITLSNEQKISKKEIGRFAHGFLLKIADNKILKSPSKIIPISEKKEKKEIKRKIKVFSFKKIEMMNIDFDGGKKVIKKDDNKDEVMLDFDKNDQKDDNNVKNDQKRDFDLKNGQKLKSFDQNEQKENNSEEKENDNELLRQAFSETVRKNKILYPSKFKRKKIENTQNLNFEKTLICFEIKFSGDEILNFLKDFNSTEFGGFVIEAYFSPFEKMKDIFNFVKNSIFQSNSEDISNNFNLFSSMKKLEKTEKTISENLLIPAAKILIIPTKNSLKFNENIYSLIDKSELRNKYPKQKVNKQQIKTIGNSSNNVDALVDKFFQKRDG